MGSSEIERLNAEIREMQLARQRLREQMHDETIAGRTRPPLSQMTRIQRRYFLEPWLTTAWVVSWGMAALSTLAAIWTPLHWSFGSTSALFLAIGVAAALAKMFHKDVNVRTEGQIQSSRSQRRDDW